ncbi:hypothetical protein CALCODRAFT_508669 [Calocera cornea HHB12733]|uniref:Uncharacterized protein n=1 Tax=Calocera cornea HHB12733 TaxID=1353952 RepID=A0A165G725_9BASI|nr:hypothetical protein CALCODRAFT_508669 [Calocera cornea HHB12733]
MSNIMALAGAYSCIYAPDSTDFFLNGANNFAQITAINLNMISNNSNMSKGHTAGKVSITLPISMEGPTKADGSISSLNIEEWQVVEKAMWDGSDGPEQWDEWQEVEEEEEDVDESGYDADDEGGDEDLTE